jgi:hypothetical protein
LVPAQVCKPDAQQLVVPIDVGSQYQPSISSFHSSDPNQHAPAPTKQPGTSYPQDHPPFWASAGEESSNAAATALTTDDPNITTFVTFMKALQDFEV